MKISKLLEKNLINLDLNTSDKEETLSLIHI